MISSYEEGSFRIEYFNIPACLVDCAMSMIEDGLAPYGLRGCGVSSFGVP